MRCEDLIKGEAVSLSASETVLRAAQLMRDKDIGFLPICDDSKRVVGTVTDRDLVIRVLAASADFNMPVSEVASQGLVSCFAQSSIEEAQELMQSKKVSRLVCLADDGALLGVISLKDIADATDEQTGGRVQQGIKQEGQSERT